MTITQSPATSAAHDLAAAVVAIDEAQTALTKARLAAVETLRLLDDGVVTGEHYAREAAKVGLEDARRSLDDAGQLVCAADLVEGDTVLADPVVCAPKVVRRVDTSDPSCTGVRYLQHSIVTGYHPTERLRIRTRPCPAGGDHRYEDQPAEPDQGLPAGRRCVECETPA